jgi:hemerythrin-like domain-containing protein
LKSTDVLRNEHIYIKKVLAGIRKQCIGIVNGNKVDFELFEKIIDFVRNFADKYHHQKEENHLFNVMADQLAKDIGTGPIEGMLTEHDFGRAYIYELEQALKRHKAGDMDARVDIIANAMGYEQMLTKHIDKEDNAIFNLAERKINPETLSKLDKDFQDIENNKENEDIRNKYIQFANSL